MESAWLGRLTGKYRLGEAAPASTTAAFAPPVAEDVLFRVLHALDIVAGHYGKTVPQVALNWRQAGRQSPLSSSARATNDNCATYRLDWPDAQRRTCPAAGGRECDDTGLSALIILAALTVRRFELASGLKNVATLCKGGW